MADPARTLTASAIANLAFRKSSTSFTEGAIAKIEMLRQKVEGKLRSNSSAEVALARFEQTSEADLDQLTVFLQDAMNDDPQFAEEVQALAQEINVGKLQGNSSMVQSNYDNARGWQTKVEGGTAYIGGIYSHRELTVAQSEPLVTAEFIEPLLRVVAEKIQESPQATIEQLVDYLKVVAESDRLSKAALQAYTLILQIDRGDELASQILVESEIAKIATQFHEVDFKKLKAVLESFVRSRQPMGIPNNVPRSGTTKFIGRETELEQLHKQLHQGDRVAISAIAGMGGVGKTELAIQYANRYKNSYSGGICWLFAREFNVGTQIVSFAQTQLNLKIPEGLELPDQVAFCWQNWREGNVLLVLDDVINYSRDVEPYLPPSASNRFKVLMTTRRKFGLPIQSISLDVLTPQQSLELLTTLIGSERVQQELDIAKTLCQWLGDLALGIEKVGRYLRKRTDLSLSTLLFRLQQKADKRQAIKHHALNRDEVTGTSTARRGVEAAFELSWDELDENSQHLGKLLSLFAPAPIPWHLAESVEQKYCENSDDGKEFDVEEVEKARTKLLDFHLLQLSQQQEQIYRLHPLVREFFRSKLEGEYEPNKLAQQEDLKQINCEVVLNEAGKIPLTLTTKELEYVTPLIPHIEEVATVGLDKLTEDNFILPFVTLGRFYEGQGLYSEAASWYEQCLSAARSRFGESHPTVAASLTNLAYLYWAQGRYSDAETLYIQALQLNTQLFGEETSVVASNLNDLAYLYESQGRYTEAEPLYLRALVLNKGLLGETDPSIANGLSKLAGLYADQGRYAEAEPLYHQTLALNQQLFGEDHPIVASTLNYLANLYYALGNYANAQTLLRQSLEIRERLLGADHPDVATSLNNLAALCKAQGQFEEAESLYQKAIKIRVQQLGSNHPDTAASLNNLGVLYESMGRYSEAEALMLQSLSIYQQLLGTNHPDIAGGLNNLAGLYLAMGRYEEAEPLYLEALSIWKQQLGAHHPQVAQILNNLAGLYKSRAEYDKAEELYLRSISIREQVLGEQHPGAATSLNNLAALYCAQGRFNQAKVSLQKALEISQRLLGDDHPFSQELRRNLEVIQ